MNTKAVLRVQNPTTNPRPYLQKVWYTDTPTHRTMRAFRYLLILVLEAANHALAATVYYVDNSCDKWKSLIEEEIQFTVDMASTTADNLAKGGYYDTLFDETLRQDPEYSSGVADTFNKIADMASGTSSQYKFQVECSLTQLSASCQNTWLT
jgi:hypothetical protein